MTGGSVAKRYATALLAVAKEEGKLGKIGEDLGRLVLEVETNKELKNALESPVIQPSAKKGILAKIQERLGLEKDVYNLMQILVDQDRASLLAMIHLVFREMADEEMGQIRVQVKVPAALGPEETKLKGILEKSLGRKVILETKVDPGLLGGFWVKVRDMVFDASLKHDLERIKESIIHQATA